MKPEHTWEFLFANNSLSSHHFRQCDLIENSWFSSKEVTLWICQMLLYLIPGLHFSLRHIPQQPMLLLPVVWIKSKITPYARKGRHCCADVIFSGNARTPERSSDFEMEGSCLHRTALFLFLCLYFSFFPHMKNLFDLLSVLVICSHKMNAWWSEIKSIPLNSECISVSHLLLRVFSSRMLLKSIKICSPFCCSLWVLMVYLLSIITVNREGEIDEWSKVVTYYANFASRERSSSNCWF